MSRTKRAAPGPGPLAKGAKKRKLEDSAAPGPLNKSQKKFELKQGKSKPAKSQSAPKPRHREADEVPIRVSKDKKGTAVAEAETEWDSDPIEESETGEESGDDDGASWPSDGAEDVDGAAAGNGGDAEDIMEEDDENELADEDDDKEQEGGVQVTSTHPDRAAAISGEGKTSSREAHQKQKEVLKERKAAKPNANEIQRAKKIWERLRMTSKMPKDERKKLVAELFTLVTGRVKEFVLKHDAGRVVQTAVKYGTSQQKRDIAKELQGAVVECAESKYAKFMIGKLVSYGDKEIRDVIVPEFYGKVRRCMRHPEASWILDDIYRAAASKSQKDRLLREWYGPDFSLFKGTEGEGGTGDLKELLANHPEKRKGVMRYLWEFVNQLVQKKTMGFTMLHDAMLQYYLNVQPGSEEAGEVLELLKGDEEYDLMKNLAFTAPGSRVVSLAFAYGTAKDRKLLLRAYKDTISTMAYDPTAHAVLIAALEVIDDTKLSGKSIFSELMPVKDISEATEQEADDLVALISDVSARTVVLAPFLDRYNGFLRPAALERVAEVQSIRSTTSKKDPAIRRSELAKTISPICLGLIQRKAADLVLSSFGCVFMYEILTRSEEGDKTAALEAVADLATSSDEQVRAALATSAGGKMLKTLVQGGRFDFSSKKVILPEERLHFADKLWSRISDDILAWATGPGSFVVAALLETDDWADEGGKMQLKQGLEQQKTDIKKVAALADTKSSGEDGKAKKRKGRDQDGSSEAKDDVAVGAQGAKKVLSMLK